VDPLLLGQLFAPAPLLCGTPLSTRRVASEHLRHLLVQSKLLEESALLAPDLVRGTAAALRLSSVVKTCAGWPFLSRCMWNVVVSCEGRSGDALESVLG
jgi:hypothetical protein